MNELTSVYVLIIFFFVLVGRLTLASNLSDSPFREEYKFMVIAKDSGTPSLFTSANVTVRVPLNHAPEVPKFFQFNVSENVRIGYIVGQLSAIDPDISEDKNHEIFFQLQDNSGNYTFYISLAYL